MANPIPISKIQINEDILEVKDANSRTSITALNQATTQNTSKITTLEGTTATNASAIESLNGEVASIKTTLENADHYNITVDSASETLIFTK